jgi:hypothetical protein
VTGALALVNDGAAPTTDACTSLPAGSMSGKIALIDRGTCDFVTKVKNAQTAGAIAAIIANNAGDSIFTMGGTSRTISIPSVMVGQTDGNTLKTKLGQSTTVRKSATAPLQHDGDIDSDVVFHEYCHGLTWRMVGRMDGPIAGANRRGHERHVRVADGRAAGATGRSHRRVLGKRLGRHPPLSLYELPAALQGHEQR